MIVTMLAMGLLPLALAQEAKPVRVNPADAKNHVGENVIVCGKVVDTKISKYGIEDRGKPVYFYVDQPQATQVFYFVAFGSKEGGVNEAIEAYKDKNVCVTGKITLASGKPYIMAPDRASIKPQAEDKAEKK